MRRLIHLLLLPIAVLSAQAAAVTGAPAEAPRIILPGGAFGQTSAPAIIAPPATPTLALSAPPALIIPAAPAPAVIAAARPLTELEASAEKMPSQDELKKLADSLAPQSAQSGEADAAPAGSLDAVFDGKLAPEASAWDDEADKFSRGPLAPALPVVAAAARSLIARLLPALYRRVPTSYDYDRAERPATGHIWTPEKGHLIELAPVRADSRGEVPSAFGVPGAARVQQKIEHLMEFAHEYFHVLFDSALRRKENHPPHSVYSAMTEGFAVGGEQLLAERMLDHAPALGLGSRDAMDLVAVLRGRRQWLDTEDSHYSEGIQSWRKAYAQGGVKGMLAFLSSLSAQRMIGMSRSDPAYQLALGEPHLLSAYLGSEQSPARRGLDAFARAARGETLNEDEQREAAAAVEQAGPEGWHRLFERTLLADKRLSQPQAAAEAGDWWRKKAEPMASVEPVFALARLSPAAGAALASYLSQAVSVPGGAVRLFDRPGPNEKLHAIITGAESLPWDAAGRKAWDDGLTRWLIGTN